MLQLVNTYNFPFSLIAHGRDHLAVYNAGVIDVYSKDVDNKLTKIRTFNVAGVTSLRISRDGRFVVVRTSTQTLIFKGSAAPQAYDLLGQSLDIFGFGSFVSIDSAAGKVTIGNMSASQDYAATIGAGDRVVAGYVKYAIVTSTTVSTSLYSGAALTNIYTAPGGKTILDVFHVSQDRFVIFLSDGSVIYNGTTTTLPISATVRRNIGRYFLLSDGTNDYLVPHARPNQTPELLRPTEL